MSAAAWVVTAWAVAASSVTLYTLWRIRGSSRRGTGARADDPAPAVLLIRPIDAPSAHELECLAQRIEYPGELEQVVVSPFPPRLPPHVGWLFSDPPTANRKAGHLAYALAALDARDRLVVVADGDAVVTGDVLRSLAREIDRGAALAWSAPLPRAEGGIGGRALEALLRRSQHAFTALEAIRVGPPAPIGKVMALGPAARQAIAEVANCAGEDLELGLRLAREGHPVALAAAHVPVRLAPLGWAPARERVARWMSVLKAHRPRLHLTVPLLVAATPLVVLAAIAAGEWIALAAAAALVVARSALAVRLARREGAGAGAGGLDWLLGEWLLLAAHARSLVSRRVEWRGRVYRLEPGGRMRPAAHAEARAA